MASTYFGALEEQKLQTLNRDQDVDSIDGNWSRLKDVVKIAARKIIGHKPHKGKE